MHLGIIGYGNIAAALIGVLHLAPVTRLTILVRPASRDAALQRAAGVSADFEMTIVTSRDDLLAAVPDLVVECAGHAAVAEHGAALIGRGTDLVIVSVGALADRALHDALTAAAAAPASGRMIFPIGAIGGLDLLSTLAPVGDLDVTYTGRKPPAAWKGTPAEAATDLDALTDPVRFFTGTAREAALHFPKNANVVAALALAGAGFERTKVDLVADPQATGNTHAYRVTSPVCRYRIEIAAAPSPDNPRTSATTAWSVLAEIRKAVDTSRS